MEGCRDVSVLHFKIVRILKLIIHVGGVFLISYIRRSICQPVAHNDRTEWTNCNSADKKWLTASLS